jgi:hypothetical protein
MSNKFQVPAILEGVTPLKDGGVSLRFHTNEVTKADKVMLMEYYQTFGWLLFQANEHQESEIPKELAKRDTGQSPSQRLRAVLFVMYKQMDVSSDFEVWYSQQIEKFIDRVKENLA